MQSRDDVHDRERRRTAAFAELSRLQAVDVGTSTFLTDLVHVVCRTVPGAEHVSLVLGPPDAPTHVATTSGPATAADGLQVMSGEGPTVDAFRERRTVASEHLLDDPRWPRLARAAQDVTRAVVAVPVQDDDVLWGVLTCYGDEAVDAATVAEAVELVAGTVASVLTGSRRHDDLRALAEHLAAALESRATIDQAKGVIMAHRGGTPDDAFDHLSAMSQHRNVKLRDVAQGIVERAGAAHRDRTDGGDARR